MPLFALSDVDPQKISLCKQGANGQTFFLRKSAGDALTEGAGMERALLVKSDWSAVYAVVAEPGKVEQGGMLAESDVRDVWTNEDEIRKACHRFAKNGGVVNFEHQIGELGGTMVENAIAHSDFSVEGPDGKSHTISKGSWYVAIEPHEELRQSIEAGEVTGVSLEGAGVRTEIEKTPGPPGTDIARNEGKQNGPLKNLIKHYLSKPHPFTSCVRDNRKRFGPAAERVCAALKDIGLQTTSWRKGGHKGAVAVAKITEQNAILKSGDVHPVLYAAVDHDTREKHGLTDTHIEQAWQAVRDAQRDIDTAAAETATIKKAGQAIFRALGRDDDATVEQLEQALAADDSLAVIAKTMPTFDALIAEREVDEQLPDAFSALREVVWRAFNPHPDEDEADPKAVISESLDQFKSYVLSLFDRVKPSGEKSDDGDDEDDDTDDLMKSIAAALGSPPEGFNFDSATIPPDDRSTAMTPLSDKDTEQIAKIVTDAIKPLGDRIEKLETGDGDGGDKTPTADSVKAEFEGIAKSVKDLGEKLDGIESDVKTLADGGSSQDDGPDAIAKGADGESEFGIFD